MIIFLSGTGCHVPEDHQFGLRVHFDGATGRRDAGSLRLPGQKRVHQSGCEEQSQGHFETVRLGAGPNQSGVRQQAEDHLLPFEPREAQWSGHLGPTAHPQDREDEGVHRQADLRRRDHQEVGLGQVRALLPTVQAVHPERQAERVERLFI